MYTLGTFGSPPCPPPEGCPPGTQQNLNYPVSSATCCKPIRGYVAPTGGSTGTPAGTPTGPKPPGGTSGPGAPKPTWAQGTTNTDQPDDTDANAMTTTPTEEPWYQEYRWYLLGGAVILALVGTAIALRAPKSQTVVSW